MKNKRGESSRLLTLLKKNTRFLCNFFRIFATCSMCATNFNVIRAILCDNFISEGQCAKFICKISFNYFYSAIIIGKMNIKKKILTVFN